MTGGPVRPADALAGLAAVEARAHALMDALGRALLGASLQARGWTFGFDRARRRLGVCRPGARRITLSAPLALALAPEDVEDTLRHEIAHAIDAERRGRTAHDAVWRALAVRCGARPERTFRGTLPPDESAPYATCCPSCGASGGLYREPALPRRCASCARAGRPAYLRVVHRTSGRIVWPGGDTPGAYGGTAGVEAVCPGCGRVHRAARVPRRAVACALCCAAAGGFDGRFRLRFQRRRSD
ncbi:MAG: SprT-like domain-containing protein [Rubricoccaceae bacterium]